MNHSYVLTNECMTVEKIDALLKRINQHIFFNCLEITFSKDDNRPSWCLTVIESGHSIVCWLNNRRSFESRKSTYESFISWVDFYIQDEISRDFQGRIQDESGIGYDSVVHTWDVPSNYFEYVKISYVHTPWILRWILLYSMKSQCPTTYRKKYTKQGVI